MQALQQKICKTCDKSQYKAKDIAGMNKYYCGDSDTYGVNAFHSCQNWNDRQCTLCVDEKCDPSAIPCITCADDECKPHFRRKVNT